MISIVELDWIGREERKPFVCPYNCLHIKPGYTNQHLNQICVINRLDAQLDIRPSLLSLEKNSAILLYGGLILTNEAIENNKQYIWASFISDIRVYNLKE